MIKVTPMKVKFETVDEFAAKSREALKAAIQDKRRTLRKKDVLVWTSVEAYQQFMSDQKYAILAAIHKYHPRSVYQLAKILNRAQQNVARDCDLLEGHGFIRFEESNRGRRVKSPRLVFDYNAVIVFLPNVTYKVEFEHAA